MQSLPWKTAGRIVESELIELVQQIDGLDMVLKKGHETFYIRVNNKNDVFRHRAAKLLGSKVKEVTVQQDLCLFKFVKGDIIALTGIVLS